MFSVIQLSKIKVNSKSITGLTAQLFSDVATQSLDLHQTAQRIVERSGHVTCDEEVASETTNKENDYNDN